MLNDSCGMQAAGASAAAFCVGAGIPLLAAAFIHSYVWRLVSLVRPWPCAGVVSSAAGGVGIENAVCLEAQAPEPQSMLKCEHMCLDYPVSGLFVGHMTNSVQSASAKRTRTVTICVARWLSCFAAGTRASHCRPSPVLVC